jgi:hypothetical protein
LIFQIKVCHFLWGWHRVSGFAAFENISSIKQNREYAPFLTQKREGFAAKIL